jgi:drug/metabolite transporter (DMT)-like permease
MGAPGGSSDPRERRLAAAETLLVTVLWASSWVLIKVGLADLDLRPLSFAGLRYALAATLLIPLAWRAINRARRSSDGGPDRRLVGRLVLIGIVVYAVTQGAQFAALALLPAATVGLVLATIPLWVASGAWLRGAEAPSRWQAVGIGGLMLGAGLYFGRLELGPNGPSGLLIAAVAALASATGQHLSRDVIRDVRHRLGGPIGVTAVSMAVGGYGLLVVGVAVEGWPRLDARAWAIVGWLAAVNTAFAFTLFNRALRHLSAVESSVIVNLMLVLVATMAWIFLDEALTLPQIAGLAIVSACVLVVQVAPYRRRATTGAIDPGPA